MTLALPNTAAVLGGEFIHLEGDFQFTDVEEMLVVECGFSQNNTQLVSAVNYTDTGVICETPTAFHSKNNDTFLHLMVNGNQYTNSVPFEFYGKCFEINKKCSLPPWITCILDCGEIMDDCQTCLSTARPLCQYCAGAGCSFSCTSNLMTCPSMFKNIAMPKYLFPCFLALINFSPDYGHIGGGEIINIQGGPFVQTGNQGEQLIYTCVFGNEGSIATVAEDGLSLTCLTPPNRSAGNVTLSVNIGASPFAPLNTFSFLYYGKYNINL